MRMSRRRCLALLALPIVSALAGCASRDSWRGFGRRGGGGPMGAEGSTIGHDFKAMPRGSVIPATGLGVDLVDSHPSLGRVDGAVVTTSSADRTGVSGAAERPH